MSVARPGFTVMEILAALGVLTVAITGAAFVMTSAFGTYRQQDRTLERHRLVHDQMETLTATSYRSLAEQIKSARRPADPPRPHVPPQADFESVSGGEALVRYRLEPPQTSEGDWRPKAIAKPAAGQTFVTEKLPPSALEATLRLQFWSPELDTPSLTDTGLIRAVYTLSGPGDGERSVKYLAR